MANGVSESHVHSPRTSVTAQRHSVAQSQGQWDLGRMVTTLRKVFFPLCIIQGLI